MVATNEKQCYNWVVVESVLVVVLVAAVTGVVLVGDWALRRGRRIFRDGVAGGPGVVKDVEVRDIPEVGAEVPERSIALCVGVAVDMRFLVTVFLFSLSPALTDGVGFSFFSFFACEVDPST